MIRVEDSHLLPLDDPRCTKPSRWRQPPRVISEFYSKTQSPSASRCNHSKQCTWMLSNLTKWWINQARWVREEWLGSLGCILIEMTKRVSHGWPTCLYRAPKRIEPLYPLHGLSMHRPDPQQGPDRTHPPGSDRPDVRHVSPPFNEDRKSPMVDFSHAQTSSGPDSAPSRSDLANPRVWPDPERFREGKNPTDLVQPRQLDSK
jgi:hypothetical protein